MQFNDVTPTLDNHWRAVILFGRNVASYKFALAKSLLELADRERELVSLSELAEPFSRHICEHLRLSDQQGTFKQSRFLDACRQYNAGELDHDTLVERTARLGFTNVIDAFHVVNQEEVPERFFVDERRESNAIRLTDRIFQLRELEQAPSLNYEVEARWRLVETAWSLGVSRNVLDVQSDPAADGLYVPGVTEDGSVRRVDVTSARDALNGYQKGRCFYCYDRISVVRNDAALADVDHFFPWTLEERGVAANLNGVWNLVLACNACNRGERGKHARVPSLRLLYRLRRRNDYLIESHHPLRETLVRQTGASRRRRHDFLQRQYELARTTLIHTWEPPARGPADF